MSLTSDSQSHPQLLREVSEDDDALLDAVVCSIIDDDKGKLNTSNNAPVLELKIKPEFQQELDMALNENEAELANQDVNNDRNYWNDENSKCPRSRSSASDSSAGSSSGLKRNLEFETDPAVLTRRQKDIDYGKNTIGYDRYTQQVPKLSRTKDHPKTPPMYQKYSRRGWDGLVKLWRKQLHYWDPPNAGNNVDIKQETNSSM